MKALSKIFMAFFLSMILMIISTFIPNTAEMTYFDIMGCEEKCTVVATGYPFPFIMDYPGLSPANSADILGAIDGHDKVDTTNFVMSFLLWIFVSFSFLMVFQSYRDKQKKLLNTEISKSMENFLNRKIYTSFDIETLQNIPDDKLEQAIIDYVLENIDRDFSKGMQAVYTTWVVEAEVNNGGFCQYYWNTSGEFAVDAIKGFKQIGALETAEIMANSVISAVHEIPEIKQNLHIENNESISKNTNELVKLASLDDLFFKDSEHLSELRIKFIRSNLPLFITNK